MLYDFLGLYPFWTVSNSDDCYQNWRPHAHFSVNVYAGCLSHLHFFLHFLLNSAGVSLEEEGGVLVGAMSEQLGDLILMCILHSCLSHLGKRDLYNFHQYSSIFSRHVCCMHFGCNVPWSYISTSVYLLIVRGQLYDFFFSFGAVIRRAPHEFKISCLEVSSLNASLLISIDLSALRQT